MHSRGRWLISGLVVALLALVVPGLALAQSNASSAHDGGSGGLRPFDHVFVIFMENHGSQSIIGDSNAPYINQLAQTYGLAANYYGVTHPSLPNYVAATSGNNWYSNSDNPSQVFDHTNIVDDLENAHRTWKAYMEDLPYAGFTGASSPNGLYVSKHNPFVLYSDVVNNPERLANIVPLTQLTVDLNSNHVPNFAWITPNLCNDMHGVGGSPCPYSNDAQLKADGDAFIHQWVTAITSSRAWTGNSAIFIAWDENDYTGNQADGGWLNANGCCDSPVVPAGTSFFPAGGTYGGGQVPLIVIGTHSRLAYMSNVAYNHYSMLRTIEDAWHMPELGMTSDHAQVNTLAEFFAPGDE
jgi:phospholipase C